MNRVRVLKVLCPQCPPPTVGELLSETLVRKTVSRIGNARIDELQVTKLVQENIVEQKASDGERGPLCSALRAECRWRLAAHEKAGKTHSRWEGTNSDLAVAHVDVAEPARTATPIIEVDCEQTLVSIGRKSGKNYSNVVLRQPVATITARR